MEKHIVYSGRAVISYRWLVSPEGQLSLEKVKERDVGIMSTPFVNTLFFCVLAVIGRICDTSQISVWLCFDEQCCEVCTVPDFPVHSYNAMHFCDSNKKPRCYSGDFASSRSSTVSTNCCKTNPCAGSVHHLWAHAVQLSNSFSLQRQCLECSATQLLLPMHGRTACCWCLREWWQQHLLKMS